MIVEDVMEKKHVSILLAFNSIAYKDAVFIFIDGTTLRAYNIFNKVIRHSQNFTDSFI